MRSRSCCFKKLAATSSPNVYETPRSLSPQPMMSLSGSAHSKSQSSPVSGTSVGRIISLISSNEVSSGERPPCMQKIFSSMTAAMGRQLKQSVNVCAGARGRGAAGSLSLTILKTPYEREPDLRTGRRPPRQGGKREREERKTYKG